MRKILTLVLLGLLTVAGCGDKGGEKKAENTNEAPAGVELTKVSLNLPGMT